MFALESCLRAEGWAGGWEEGVRCTEDKGLSPNKESLYLAVPFIFSLR